MKSVMASRPRRRVAISAEDAGASGAVAEPAHGVEEGWLRLRLSQGSLPANPATGVAYPACTASMEIDPPSTPSTGKRTASFFRLAPST